MGSAAESWTQRQHSSISRVSRASRRTARRCTGIRPGRTALATSISGWPHGARSSSSFGPAANVGPEINGPGPEFGAAISQNEKQLFFSSARPGNVGQIDIWVVERRTKSAFLGHSDQRRYAELAILPGHADIRPQWEGRLLHGVSARGLRRPRRLVRQSHAMTGRGLRFP